MTERDVFEAALDLPPENRVAYLDRAYGGDAALRQRLEALLRRNHQAGSFLEMPAAEIPLPRWGSGTGAEGAIPTVDAPAVSEHPGTVIGPYKLLELLSPASVSSLAWHPDGKLLAAGGNDFQVHLWNVDTGQQHAVLRGHQNNGISTAFSPDGNLLCSSAWDGTACLWDPWAGRQLVRFAGLLSHFSEDGRWVAARNGTRLGLWELASGREYRTLPDAGKTRSLNVGSSWKSDRLWLAAAGDGVTIWDLPTRKHKAFIPLGPTKGVIFHPSGRELLTSGSAGLYRWPLQAGPDCLHIGPPHRLAAPGSVHQISLDERGRILAVIDRDRHGGWLMNLEEPSARVRHFDHLNAHSVATSPDGRWIASGTLNGHGVQVWETCHSKLACLLLPDERAAAVAFSPDGRQLVISTRDQFGVWEVGSWKSARQIRRERADDMFVPMAFTGDGKVLALCTARDLVQLVDPATGRPFANLQPPSSDSIDWMSFCPDGSQLVVGSNTGDHGLVRVWDLRLIRAQWKDIGLDWELPSYPPPPETGTASPLEVKVGLGSLAAPPP